MNKITFSVPNINCGHCVHTIQSELMEVEGVTAVKAEISTKLVEVVFDPPADESNLRKTLAEINYPALP